MNLLTIFQSGHIYPVGWTTLHILVEGEQEYLINGEFFQPIDLKGGSTSIEDSEHLISAIFLHLTVHWNTGQLAKIDIHSFHILFTANDLKMEKINGPC